MPITLDYTGVASSSKQIPDPPGHQGRPVIKDGARKDILAKPDEKAVALKARRSDELKMKRAWDLALSPAKALPMNAIMLYFSGSGIQIFSLGMIFTLLTGPITAVAGILRAFEALRPSSPATAEDADGSEAEPSYLPIAGPMLVYIGCQSLVLALGLWKCWSMGVLPSGPADWLQFETRLDPPEWSAIRSISLG